MLTLLVLFHIETTYFQRRHCPRFHEVTSTRPGRKVLTYRPPSRLNSVRSFVRSTYKCVSFSVCPWGILSSICVDFPEEPHYRTYIFAVMHFSPGHVYNLHKESVYHLYDDIADSKITLYKMPKKKKKMRNENRKETLNSSDLSYHKSKDKS